LLNLVLPKIECDASSQSYGRFIIGPLESGYGITLGNALRRVLLSSLLGAAVTSIRISGVHHEFSAIPHVKEDTTALILNLKQLRLKLQGDESARLRVEV
jgi:DNA-directed RNA polymerase subunit alpha